MGMTLSRDSGLRSLASSEPDGKGGEGDGNKTAVLLFFREQQFNRGTMKG